MKEMLCLLIFVANKISSGVSLEQDEINEIVEVHNQLRRNEGARNMIKLAWDKRLALKADILVRGCHFVHDQVNGSNEVIGQNLYTSNNLKVNYTSVVNKWYRQKESYVSETQSCIAKTCLNYLQVVWAETSRVGCASFVCDQLDVIREAPAIFVVCNYHPPGTYLSQDPYVKGEPCGACKDVCEDGLCVTD